MMLSLRLFPSYFRCNNHYLKQSQLHTCAKLMTAKDPPTSSSSSSSDSSDSDSDKEDKINKKQTEHVNQKNEDILSSEKMNERLSNLLLKIAEVSKVQVQESNKLKVNKNTNPKKDQPKPVLTPGVIDVAIKHRSQRFKKLESEKKKEPLEKQIAGAAKDVAKSIGDESGKTEAELLGQILKVGPSEPKEEVKAETSENAPKNQSSLSQLLSSMKVDKPSTTLEEHKQEMAMKLKHRFSQNSISLSLLKTKKIMSRKKDTTPDEDVVELNAPCTDLGIFKTLPKEEPEHIPPLSTWEEMEKREMKLATLTTPQNIFQELIQWTEQGKLWHFPINNEQGMEEEEQVHFSEHVFLERHLKGWCPKKGPVRNFMELVCIGLSKNPYMTVKEKIGHITWYKNYFEEKKDLLNELGALDPKPPAEKQIAA